MQFNNISYGKALPGTYLDESFRALDKKRCISVPPVLTKDTITEVQLGNALVSNLYMPGNNPEHYEKFLDHRFNQASSVVIDFEDAMPEEDIDDAKEYLLEFLDKLAKECKEYPVSSSHFPFLFIRVRNYDNFTDLVSSFTKEHLEVIMGFVFPKADKFSMESYFSLLHSTAEDNEVKLYGIPILETADVVDKSTRTDFLLDAVRVVEKYKSCIPAIQIGGTDMCGLLGLRRDTKHTIYDIKVINDCIVDIISAFRKHYLCSPTAHPISILAAPCEFYGNEEDSPEIQGLLQELGMDVLNGMSGKIAIHPTQVRHINDAFMISKEDYINACCILHWDEAVFPAEGAYQMNETNPHKRWAERVVERSEVLGIWNTTKE